jgi:hypothetical protein
MAGARDVLERMRSVASREHMARRDQNTASIADEEHGPKTPPARGEPPGPVPDSRLPWAATPAAPAGAVPARTPRKRRVPGRAAVRYTVDLDRELHRYLKIAAVNLEVEASEIVRALLRLMRDDHQLASRVQDEVLRRRATSAPWPGGPAGSEPGSASSQTVPRDAI